MAFSTQAFFELVFPWPDPQGPGHAGLYVNSPNKTPERNGGKSWVIGWPFKTLTGFLERAKWIDHGTNDFYNVWFCTSTQSETGLTANKKPKAIRKAANALALKAIWIDIDVKAKPADWPAAKPWTHYETLDEAWVAFRGFQTKLTLPSPSAVVHSGGGFHIYWASDRPLSVDDWRPFAAGLRAALVNEGVKCDAGLTTDPARILRVPETLNHKYAPPRLVQIVDLQQAYNFETILGFLKNIHPEGSQNGETGEDGGVVARHAVTEPGALFDTPDPAFAGLEPSSDLQSGIERDQPFLVDPTPVFAKAGCRFLREALTTGGKDFDNPKWNLSVLCTAFMERGDVFAHEISKGHATYTEDDTQALYDRKVADRAERGIGYPSCSAIAGTGFEGCKTCPHLPKGKSPLNIRAVVTAAVNRAPSGLAKALNLPEAYDINEKGKVCLIEQITDRKGNVSEVWKQLFHNTLLDAWPQKDPDVMHMLVTTDKGNTHWAALRIADVAGQGFEKRLVENKILYVAENKSKIEGFFMAFMDKMQQAAEAQKALGFGWYRPAGPMEGFAYGGKIFKADGTVVPAGIVDYQTQLNFTPTGDEDHWHKAASYLLRQERPELDLVLAVSFAAPIMEMTGTTGAMVAITGLGGLGKSYSLEVGAAVWGDPKRTKEGKTTTEKSLLNRLGSTSNLPAFWDEVSDEEVQKKVLTVLHETTGGGEGGRLTSDIKQRARGTWSTIVNVNSNRPMRDYICKMQKDHGAALYRLLEYEIRPTDNPKGRVPTSESDQALAALRHHYGNVGLAYAELIAVKHHEILDMINANLRLFENKLNPTMPERMWIGLVAALLTGAQVANMLPRPVGFDITRIFDFLMEIYLENREYQAKANVNPQTSDYAEDYLAQYLKDRQMETIWTTSAAVGPGRATRCEFRRLQPNVAVHHGINVRFDRVDKTLRFSRMNFEGWCNAQPDARPYNSIITSLKKTYGMHLERKTLGAGTPFKVSQEWVYTIDVTGHQDLLDAMNAPYDTPDNSDLGVPTGTSGDKAA